MENRRINQVEYANLLSYLMTVYLQNNKVDHHFLPDLIRSVNKSLSESIHVDQTQWQASDGATNIGKAVMPARTPQEFVHDVSISLPTAKDISASIHDDYLVSFEDGKKYKALPRHLGRLGMSPTEYRRKWGLPPSYPMMCKSTREKRSEIARRHELARLGSRARRGRDNKLQ